MKQRSITKNPEEFHSKLLTTNDQSSDYLTICNNQSVTTNNDDSTSVQMSSKKQLKPIVKSSTKNPRPIKSSRFITIINSNSDNNNINNPLIKSTAITSKKQPSKFKLPKINVLADADKILKNRERSHGISTNPVISRSALKKSADVRLKNYMIKEIIKKREEIKETEKSMEEKFQEKEKSFEKRYQDYINEVERNQQKNKEEENELNSLKIALNKLDNIYSLEKTENKKLEEKLKRTINNMLVLKKYGSFVHKIFGYDFLYDKLKEIDGRNHFKLMEDFIKIYDEEEKKFNDNKNKNNTNKNENININDDSLDNNNLLLSNNNNNMGLLLTDNQNTVYKNNNESDENNEENNDENNKENISDLLFFQGEDLLIQHYNHYEDQLVKFLKSNDVSGKEKLEIQKSYDEEIEILKKRKEECERDIIKLNEHKKEQILLMKNYRFGDIEETKKYFSYILELGDAIGVKNKPTGNKLKNLADCLYYCKDTIKALEKKEEYVNDYINEIEDIFINGTEDDKCLIGEMIWERKKVIKKAKQEEIKKNQKEVENAKNLKAIDRENRIVVKGRKVFNDFPLIKNQKKKKKIVKKKNGEETEFLYYSSDSNE